MEPALDPVEIELIPNQIAVFEDDLSYWQGTAPEFVGPPESRMKKRGATASSLAKGPIANGPIIPVQSPAPPKSV